MPVGDLPSQHPVVPWTFVAAIRATVVIIAAFTTAGSSRWVGRADASLLPDCECLVRSASGAGPDKYLQFAVSLTLEFAMKRHHNRLLLTALVLASLLAACSSTSSTPAASSAVQATTRAATTAPTGLPTPMPSGSITPSTTAPAAASPTGHPQPSPTPKPAKSSMPTATTATAPAAPAATKPARSSTPTTTTPAAVRGAATLAVTIKNFAFMIPGPVKAGRKITVRNDDSEIHTFTLDGRNPLSVPGHSTATRTAPTQPGKHQVTCDYHGDMHATLTVTA